MQTVAGGQEHLDLGGAEPLAIEGDLHVEIGADAPCPVMKARADTENARRSNYVRHGITRYKVAKLAGMQQRRIDEIFAGKRAVTGDTALRLARLFGIEAIFWMNMQAQYDLETADRTLHQRIEAEVTPLALAA